MTVLLPSVRAGRELRSVSVVARRLESFQAATSCLQGVARATWSDAPSEHAGAAPRDAVVMFADDFAVSEVFAFVEHELESPTQCVVVVASRRGEYLPLCSKPGAARRLTILPQAIWRLVVADVVLSLTDEPTC